VGFQVIAAIHSAELSAPFLPTAATPLIGREGERAVLQAWLAQPAIRLITLTGSGGVGKTRLALQLAADAHAVFAEGTYFVSLTALSDPQLVLPTLARAFGLTDAGPQALLVRLAELLAQRRVLLVLDNCEHLLAAAPDLADLLAAVPGLTILATSRVRLQLAAEYEFIVSPLALPDLAQLPPLEQLATWPAVALFLARVRAVCPDFALTTANMATVAAICVRLDGLPFALELAAARIKLLSPSELLARLDQRLHLLTITYADRPQHQQTLRSTLDWSFRLLPPAAQQLLAGVGVFSGGWTAAAATAICADLSADPTLAASAIPAALATLVDHSLVECTMLPDGTLRYTCLETIRVYAVERLAASGQFAALAARHATYYAAFAEQAGPELVGAQQVTWLNRLEYEHANLRAALQWGLTWQPTLAARIGAAIWRFWLVRGYLHEGRQWLDLLAKQVTGDLCAAVLLGAGRLARQQGALDLAEARLNAGLTIQRTLGDHAGAGITLGYLGVIAYDRGDFVHAEALHQASLKVRMTLDDQWGIAATLTNLGEVARQRGDLAQAFHYHTASLERFRAIGEHAGIATVLLNLGMLEIERRCPESARPLLLESLALWVTIGEQVDIAECLEGLACVATLQHQPLRAATLAGAAAGVRTAAGSLISPADQQRLAHTLAHAQAQLTPAEYTAAWQKGHTLPLAEAVAYAREPCDPR
jgi:predicted ATPase